MLSEIAHCRFQENSVSKLLNEKNSEILCVDFKYHKVVSQKASFWFFYEDISVVTQGLNAPKYPFEVSMKTVLGSCSMKRKV